MFHPTHEQISQRAHELWQSRQPGLDNATQNWLDAESELTVARTLNLKHESLALASEQAAAERTAQQNKHAREPIVAHHTGPKAAPPETGKPLWSRPHSS